MRVEIIKPFATDSANGRTHYVPGQEVPNGQKSWVEKGLAREMPTKKPDEKSSD